METQYPTADLIQLTAPSKINKEGEAPIVLQVYVPITRQRKFYRTGHYCRPEHFPSVRPKFEPFLKKAADAIDTLRLNRQPFSFEAFERHFMNKSGSVSVQEYLQEYLDLETKESNKKAIKDLVSVLQRCYGTKPVYFGEISFAWLTQFIASMRRLKTPYNKEKTKFRTLSENGVRFHLRTLRKYYNLAKREGLAPRTPDDKSPFAGIDTQSVPSEEVKRYFTPDELRLFVNHKYKPHHKDAKAWKEAKELFITSYLCAGMNLMDILDLEWSDIRDGSIVLRRAKTTTPLTIRIGTELKRILDKRSRENRYVFQEFRKEGTAEEVERNHNNILNRVTKGLKKIATQAGIKDPEQINFYSARHTFAVHYMQNTEKASVFQLMLYLGHSSEQSTRNYLQSLIGNVEIKQVEFLDTMLAPVAL